MASLLFDLKNGVSGDMIVGALLAAGASRERLEACLNSLKLSDYDIKINIAEGGESVDFSVVLKDNLDSDFNYLYGSKNAKLPFSERKIDEIFAILDKSLLNSKEKDMAKAMFRAISLAEGRAHNIAPSEVCFHESGAMDSIIDIVSIAVCYVSLGSPRVFTTDLYEGFGTIRTRKGIIPIPTPAVKNLCEIYSLKLRIDKNLPVEIITPTGLCALGEMGAKPLTYEIRLRKKVGYGLGKRDYSKFGLTSRLKVEIIDI